jgi:uroporphyrin-III C-methyltransferase/precorrin-2 dehydrogenase/sirohydrochlorin ferrochelatase
VDTLLAHGRPPDTPVAVVQNGTTKEQRVFTGTLDEIADIVATHHVHPPAVVVIGDVVTALAE